MMKIKFRQELALMRRTFSIKNIRASFSAKNIKSFFKEKRWKKWTWKKFFRGIAYAFIALLFVTAILFAWYAKDLPTPDKIASQKMAESTKIYDRTGQTLLYETGQERRTIVKSDQIAQVVKDATIATEDPNFYNNHGVEPRAILSAIGSRILGRTNTLRGGSTITQQYVKNSFLTSDRSISRKIKEAILSIELEFMYSKDEILTMYLNEIPYGNATGGIEAAAQAYYGIPAKDLNLTQAATLAAIPQAPTYYSPYGTHVDNLIGRKDYVLDQMVKYNKISSDQAATAKKTDSTTVGTALKARHDSILAPHFAMYVLQQAADQYGEETIQNTGMTIITTLDYSKQQVAQQSIDDNKNNLKKYAAQNAAVVSVDPKTGQILAMVGSADYFDTSIDGNVNVADSLRQPGSSFKVFEYSTLLKQNYSPSKILYDFQTDFGGGYTPKNYNGKFNGPVTVRYALQNSLNIPAVKALALAGIDNTIQTAKDFGITSITKSANYYGLSMALGTAEVKPVEMASAYGTLANQGVHEELTPFIKITDSTGKVLYDFDKDHPKGTQVIDPQVAYEMANILSDNASRTPTFGGRSALYFSDRTVAAKTGTTQENRDGWTCGFTPSIATAVWTGNNMPSPMKTDAVNIAGPIFHAFMTKALAGTPNEAFAQPTGIQSLTVEKYSSKLPDQYSSETTTDIFATWQVPKDTEDTYKKVTVCKGTNLVAPENTDSALTEIKVFADLHSEQPNNPNWENPVRAWATQNNLAVNVPTDKCNPASLAPTISITNPSNNSTVSGTTAITVSTTSPSGTQKVSYSLDDVSIGESASSPYSLTFDFSSIADGKHTLSAQITDSNGMTAKSTVSIIISDNGVKISQLLTKVVGTTATVTWTTSSAASSSVLYSHDGGSPLEESSTTLTTTHSVTLSGLVTGKIYNITVSSKDASNNVGSQTANFST